MSKEDRMIEALGRRVDREFRNRDSLTEVWNRTGDPRDERAMLRQEAKAARLLDEYNDLVRAQIAKAGRDFTRAYQSLTASFSDQSMSPI